MPDLKYDNETCNTFVQEVYDAGYDPEHYNGRYLWEGPAVRIETPELQTVIRATSMKLQWDQMGRDGLIVYPVRKGKLIEGKQHD